MARAALGRHHPGALEVVFRNIQQTTGPGVVLSVGRFISRIRALPDNAELGPEEGAAARAMLDKRGLTEELLSKAEALVVSLDDFLKPKTEEKPDDTSAAIQEAEDAMWTWYLEWSAIARAAIKDRRDLRRMGFLRYDRKGKPAEVVELEAPMAEPGTVQLPAQPPVAGLLANGQGTES